MIQQYQITEELRKKLKRQIATFENKKILIIGDVGVDEYVMGDVHRISPEAPVPVLEVESEDIRLGLAANVAQNIKSLGGIPLLVSVVGQDQGQEILNKLLTEQGISTDHLISDPTRPTTRKTRIMAKHHHLVRVDYEVRQSLNESTFAQFKKVVTAVIEGCDGVILQDYAKGVVSAEVIRFVYATADQFKKPVYVDPHRTNRAEFYSGCHLLKPNLLESLALIGMETDDYKKESRQILKVGETLKTRTHAKHIVLTQGKEGMTIFNQSGSIVQVPTFAKNVFDVTGAGDTVISALALGTLSGLTLEEACVLANFAAGVVVAQVGCVPCNKDELTIAIDQLHPAGAN